MSNRPHGVEYIALLAFLTVHRPVHCQLHPWYKHTSNCDCLSIPHFVIPALKPSLLQSFGGQMTIEEYRREFMMIKNYDWVDRYFRKNPRVHHAMDEITATKEKRMYTFYLYTPSMVDIKIDTTKDIKKSIAPPKVVKSKRKY